ncbi:hypothetical protein HOE22_01655 [Candidatus Woesearchaeota archaeon]|jgi:hypothetical protein|nr:hypothetical protein [Candidatus Woesearchaeota archaeon]
MKRQNIFTLIALVTTCFLESCYMEPYTCPPFILDINRVIIADDYNLPISDCRIIETNEINSSYVLSIRLHNNTEEYILFNVQHEENDSTLLLKRPEHGRTGQVNGSIKTHVNKDSFVLDNLNEEMLSIIWDDVSPDDGRISGNGYIKISDSIFLTYNDSLWVDGHFAYPNDPTFDEYYDKFCNSGIYYPKQEIWFECSAY